MVEGVVTYEAKEYRCDSGRGTGSEKVICVLLTSPEDLLQAPRNPVLSALADSRMSGAIGLYFYRFASAGTPFIKIGESARPSGIANRFQAGWHRRGTDTYLTKRRNGCSVYSEFYSAIMKLSKGNTAYLVFYEHHLLSSHTKADEMYAFVAHRRLFKQGTISPERPNANGLLGRGMVWHRSAFSEVVRGRFPDGSPYPRLVQPSKAATASPEPFQP